MLRGHPGVGRDTNTEPPTGSIKMLGLLYGLAEHLVALTLRWLSSCEALFDRAARGRAGDVYFFEAALRVGPFPEGASAIAAS
jgi:hypothetical protein